MVNWDYKKASKFISKTKAEVIVVPRFREFSKDFSGNYAFVYFVSKNSNTEIYLKSVSVSTPDRSAATEMVDESLNLEIVMLESPIQPTKKTLEYPYKRVRIFSYGSGVTASNWNHEDELIFTVVYSVDGGSEIIEEFKMIKSEYTGIAWPT